MSFHGNSLNLSSSPLEFNYDTIKFSEIIPSLQSELLKDPIKPPHLRETSKLTPSSFVLNNLDITNSESQRNLSFIISLLSRIPQIKQIFTYYQLEKDNLECFVNHIQYITKNKGDNIIKQRDSSNYFYIVLKGTVSIYKSLIYKELDPLTKKENAYMKNHHLYNKSTGFLIGEKDLIFTRPYSISVNAFTDCELISIDKEVFKICLYKQIYPKEMELRSYIRKCLFPKYECSFSTFEVIYSILEPISFIDNKHVVIKEGNIANKIYIVFKSYVTVWKKKNCLLKIIEGGVIGMECLFGKENYEHSVLTGNEKCFLFGIDITKIDARSVRRIRKNLEEEFKDYNGILKERNCYKDKIAKYEKKYFGVGEDTEDYRKEKIDSEIENKFKLAKGYNEKKNIFMNNEKKMKIITSPPNIIGFDNKKGINNSLHERYIKSAFRLNEKIKQKLKGSSSHVNSVNSHSFSKRNVSTSPHITRVKTESNNNYEKPPINSKLTAFPFANYYNKKPSVKLETIIRTSNTTFHCKISKSNLNEQYLPPYNNSNQRSFYIHSLPRRKNKNNKKQFNKSQDILPNYVPITVPNSLIVNANMKTMLMNFKSKAKTPKKFDSGMFQIPLASDPKFKIEE